MTIQAAVKRAARLGRVDGRVEVEGWTVGQTVTGHATPNSPMVILGFVDMGEGPMARLGFLTPDGNVWTRAGELALELNLLRA